MPALLALLLLSSVATAPDDSVGLRVMTFNIRYANRGDGVNAWHLRRHLVAGVIRFHRPDVVGLQEALGEQVDDLAARLPDYASFGIGRDDGGAGERCAILYRSERLELLEEGTFWLSRTPDRPSADWGATLHRICTWGRFRERASGLELTLLNTHFDHRSEESRLESAKLVRRRADELAGEGPVVVLGDLNCGELSPPYRALIGHGEDPRADPSPLVDALYAAREPNHGPTGTFTGFGKGHVAGPRIDHVLVRGDLRVERLAVLADTRDGRTPSDHRPVLADLTLGVPFEQPRIELRTGWRFQTDPEDAGIEAGWQRPGFDDADWTLAVAGEIWELQGHPDYDGAAWYRRAVRVPESWRGAGVHLVWDGIADAARLWVDGEEVVALGGPEESVYLRPVAVRLPAELVEPGRDHLIALRVEDTGGDGGILDAPPALVRDRATSTDWAARFERDQWFEGLWVIPHPDSRPGRSFPVGVPDTGAAETWLAVDVLPDGEHVEGTVRVRLLRPDGSLAADAFAEPGTTLRIERCGTTAGTWLVEVEDARGHGASGDIVATWYVAKAPR